MTTLRARAVYGVKWTATSTAVVTILKYVRTIVLARLLVPDDFGLMTMVTVIVGLGQAFSDMGISLALIWKQDASEDELSSVYWFNILTGVLVSALVAAAAPLIVRFYNEPRLYDMIIWMAPVFPVMIGLSPDRYGQEHAANAIGFQVASAYLGGALVPALIGIAADSVGLEVIGLLLFTGGVLTFAAHEMLIKKCGI